MAEQALTDANYDIVERLQGFATAKGRTILELAMSWLAMKPEVISVIAGATRPEQVEANATAAAWKMSADEIGEIDRLTARA
jgi:aryl-alcohol dehydrogenase-like predicted oxidoreductase